MRKGFWAGCGREVFGQLRGAVPGLHLSGNGCVYQASGQFVWKQSDHLVRPFDIVFNDARSFLPRALADQRANLLHSKLEWWLGLWLVLHPGHALAQTKAEKPIRQAPDFTEVRTYIRTQLAAQSIPSIAVAVAVHDKIIWEEGFGSAVIENGKAATPDTPYYLASVTKSITGTAILVLRDHGTIDLDQSVNNYLGSAKLHSPMWDSSQATVRRVASHIAGLTTYSRKCAADDPMCRVSTEIAIERYGVLFWHRAITLTTLTWVTEYSARSLRIVLERASPHFCVTRSSYR